MVGFRTFLRESPHEAENRVPVAVYFSNPIAPNTLAHPENIPVKRTRQIPVSRLFPTQRFIDQQKVMGFVTGSLVSDGVLRAMRVGVSDYFVLVDGHHRACAEIARG